MEPRQSLLRIHPISACLSSIAMLQIQDSRFGSDPDLFKKSFAGIGSEIQKKLENMLRRTGSILLTTKKRSDPE